MTTPTTETGIVEKVVRAIHEARFAHPRYPREPDPFDDPSDIEYATRLARAAIAAMPDSTQLLQTMAGALEQGRVAELTDVLKPFAAMRLSYEGEVSDCLARSPAAEMRRRADAVELRDAQILRARATLAQFRAQEQRS